MVNSKAAVLSREKVGLKQREDGGLPKRRHQPASQGPSKMAPTKEVGVLSLLVLIILPTLAAGGTTETIDSTNYEMKELKKSSMALCLTPLEGGPDVDAKLRLEVVPDGPGNDKIHLAGNVDVPKHLLKNGSGTSLLRYEYTTIDNKITLKVTLNNEELSYSPFQDMYSGRYKFKQVKFYIRGRVTVTSDCSDPPPPTPTNETIDSNKYEMKEMKKSSMALCLTPLEGGPDVDAKLRLEVVPDGAGNDRIYLAGNVDVPKHLLEKGSGTSLLRYEYTTIDNKVALKVTLNNEELSYSPFQDIYSGRYKFKQVKFYIRGRVEVAYDCPDPSATKNPDRPTTTTTPTTMTTLPSTAPPTPPPSKPKTTPTTTMTMVPSTTTTPPPSKPKTTPATTTTKPSTIATVKPTSPAINTPRPKTKEATTSKAETGTKEDKSPDTAGGMLIPGIIALVVLVIVVVVVSACIIHRRRNNTESQTTNNGENEPLNSSNSTDTANQNETQNSNRSTLADTQVYKPLPGMRGK